MHSLKVTTSSTWFAHLNSISNDVLLILLTSFKTEVSSLVLHSTRYKKGTKIVKMPHFVMMYQFRDCYSKLLRVTIKERQMQTKIHSIQTKTFLSRYQKKNTSLQACVIGMLNLHVSITNVKHNVKSIALCTFLNFSS